MAYPSFDTEIKDSWTITKNNTVGSTDRGTVPKPAHTSELVVTTIPQTVGTDSCETLQEFVNSADANGYDLITFDISSAEKTLKDTICKIPDGMSIYCADGNTVKIELKDVVELRYNNNTYSVQTLNTCGLRENGKYLVFQDSGDSQLLRQIDFNNGEILLTNLTRTSAVSVGEDYMAIAYDYASTDEWGLVSNGSINSGNITYGDSVEFSTILFVDDSSPSRTKMQVYYDKVTDERLFFIRHLLGSSNKIRLVRQSDVTGSPTWSQDDIDVEFEATDTSSLVSFEICTKGDYYNARHDDIADYSDLLAMVVTSDYRTYIYNSLDFLEESISTVVDGVLTTMVALKNYKGYNKFVLMGGSKIVSYDGSNYVIEKDFSITDNLECYSEFILQRNESTTIEKIYFVLYYGGKTEVWVRNDRGEWSFVERLDDSLIPLGSSQSKGRLNRDVLFMHPLTNALWYTHEESGQIFTGKANSLTSLEIENKNYLGVSYDYRESSTLISSEFSGLLTTEYCDITIDHCTIKDDIGAIGIYQIWNITNSVIDTMYTCVSLTPEKLFNFEGNNAYNKYISKESWILYINGNFFFEDFAGTMDEAFFKNNSCVGYNGIYYNSTDLPRFMDCVIYSRNIAFFTTKVTNLNVTYCNIYGRLEEPELILNSPTNIVNVNPLFKDITAGDFELQHEGEDYPVTSPISGKSSTGGDIGCFDTTYVNDGEVNKVGVEITGFSTDITPNWKYPNQEVVEDYTGNIIAYRGLRRRVLTLEKSQGEISPKVLSRIEKLYISIDPLRFYPNGADGISIFAKKTSLDNDGILHLRRYRQYLEYPVSDIELEFDFSADVIVNNVTYYITAEIPYIQFDGDFTIGSTTVVNVTNIVNLKEGMLLTGDHVNNETKIESIDTINNTIELSTPAVSTVSTQTTNCYEYYFLNGFLRGFYLEFQDGGTTYNLRIDENSENMLYLKNTELISLFPGTLTHTCKCMYIYTTFKDHPELRNGFWAGYLQKGDIIKMELHELEDKFEYQQPFPSLYDPA